MLRVGTDCSGIEAPIEALRQLNISYDHIFSSEIDILACLLALPFSSGFRYSS